MIAHCGRLRWVGAAAVCAAVLLTTIAFASRAEAAGVTSCAATIMSCGCTITDGALHAVGTNLSAAQGLNKDGSCINVKHSFATLDVFFFDLTGAGSGIGIRILKGAKRVSVQNWGEIDDWSIGIEDDGNGAMISSDDGTDVDGNTTAGVFLNKVKGSTVSGFELNGNGTGVLLKGSSRNQIDSLEVPDCPGPANGVGYSLVGSNNNTVQAFAAGFGGGCEGNTGDGVDLVKSNKNSIADFDASDNGGNGVKLDRSSGNGIVDYSADDNAADGVLLDAGSSKNIVADGGNDDNLKNGIEVSAGDKTNNIHFNTAEENLGTDLVDGNTNCDKDVWSNNCFDTESQSCIGTAASRCAPW